MDTNAHADGIDATYAHPERLVTTAWLADRIAAGETGPGSDLVILESDEDVLLFETGHIPTAQRTTATGRSPGLRIRADARRLPRSRSGRGLQDRQWRMTRGLTAYSCGNSRSLTLRSLLIPFRGT